MSICTHVAVGAAVGSFMPNGLAGGVAGFVSHVLGDLIPHYDPPVVGKKHRTPVDNFIMWTLLAVDFFLGVVILFIVKDYPQMFFGGLVGGLVDLDAFFIHGLEKVGIMIHDSKSNWHKQTNIVKGLFNQGVLTLVALTVIYLQVKPVFIW